MNPTEPSWPLQPTPSSAGAMLPSTGRSPRRHRAGVGGLAALALVATWLLLALTSCSPTDISGSGLASSSAPTVGREDPFNVSFPSLR
jgi:hypothetical protein